jgi:hypothetical protein
MPDARDVIRAVVQVEPEDDNGHRISPEQGDEIAHLFEGDYALFVTLDEKPGLFMSPWYHGVDGHHRYDHWHYKLRQARNDARNHFFDILRDDAQGKG